MDKKLNEKVIEAANLILDLDGVGIVYYNGHGSTSPINPEGLAALATSHEVLWDRIRDLAQQLAIAARPIWDSGDGYGGAVMQTIYKEFIKAGLPSRPTDEKKIRGGK